MSASSSSSGLVNSLVTGDMRQQVFNAKHALRKTMLKTLRGMSDQELQQQSQAVAQIVFDSPFFKRAKTVGCYLSMGKGELRTTSIVDKVLAQSSEKKLYIPYLPPAPAHEPSSHSPTSPSGGPIGTDNTPDMKMLRLYSKEDRDACPLDKWGILDPGENRKDQENVTREDALNEVAPPLDVILIPGVAFDEDCNRLGRGKAFYDTFLYNYTTTRTSPLLVALALSPQVLQPGDKVPVTETDFRLDGVVSPAGLIWRKGINPE